MSKISIVFKKAENGYMNRMNNGKPVIHLTISESILVEHFKELMRLVKLYDKKEKTGFVLDTEKAAFHQLLERIESSDDEKCKQSHEKSKAKVIKKAKMSFEDYCEEYLDQHISLMSEADKAEAFKTYLKMK